MRRFFVLLAACQGGSEPVPAPSAVPAPPPRSVAHTISSGAFHTCARTRDGHVACWGQLANGATVLRGNRFFPAENPTVPRLVPGLEHVAGVLAGYDVHCAWTDAGGAACWGPVGSQETVAPAPIAALHDVVQIDGGAGSRMLCALSRDGRVQCWGDPEWHDHREGARGKALLAPTELHAVPELYDAVEIAVGFEQACARRKSGLVACWDGFAPAVIAPVGAAAGAIALAGSGSGIGGAFAALLPGGKVYAWQLPGGGPVAVPANVPADAREISVGGGICVRGSGVTCWAFGATDAQAIALDHPVAISSGAGASCARLADGSARCWGDDGLRGDGAAPQAIDAVAVPGLADVRSVAIDGRSTCAIANGGKAYCWGAEFAHTPQFDGDYPEDDHPIEVALPAAAATITLENSQACATLVDSKRYCWGNVAQKTVEKPRLVPLPVDTGGEAHHRKLLALPGITGAYGGGFAREAWTCVSDAKDVHCLYTHYGRGETDYYPEQGFERIAGGRQAIGVPPSAAMCVRFADGGVKCGGGVGSNLTDVPGVAHVVQLAHGPNDAICARLTDATVSCWPEELRNANLGPGPAPVVGATDAIELVGGSESACIIRADRTLRCWGAWTVIGVPAPATGGATTTVKDLAM